MEKPQKTQEQHKSSAAACCYVILQKWWLLVLVGAVCVLASTFWIRIFHKPIYRATMMYAVICPLTDGDTGGLADAGQVSAVVEELLQTDMVKERIRAEGGQLQNFCGTICVLRAGESNLLSVSIEDTDPNTALLALQTLTEVLPSLTDYLSQTLELRILQSPTACPDPVSDADTIQSAVQAAVLGMAVTAWILCWRKKKALQMQGTEAGHPEKIDLYAVGRQFLCAWKRGWALVLALVLLGSAAWTMVQNRRFTPVYTASARFTLHTGKNTADTSFYEDTAAQFLAKSFPDVVQTQWMQTLLCRQLGTQTVPAVITAQALAQTNLIQLTVQSADAQDAYSVLLAVLDCYPQVAQHMADSPRITMRQQAQVPTQPDRQFSPVPSLVKGGAAGLLASFVVLVIISQRKNKKNKRNDPVGETV